MNTVSAARAGTPVAGAPCQYISLVPAAHPAAPRTGQEPDDESGEADDCPFEFVTDGAGPALARIVHDDQGAYFEISLA